MNVGWIGTGKLGLPMAARIAASGIGVRAYVRSPERLEAIRARHVVCVKTLSLAHYPMALGWPMIVGKVDSLKAADYTTTFSGHQMAKDLDLILDAANATGVGAPLAAFMRTQFAAIRARDEIDQDFIAVVKVAQWLAGLGETRDP